MIIFLFKMTECIVCYEDIKNKVSLECTHELCLNCFVNNLKAKNKFSCAMCRHKYNFHLKDEEQVFEIPEGYMPELYDPSYEINITQEQYSIFQDLISSCYPDYNYKYYRTSLNSSVFCFAILNNIDVDDDMIEYLIFDLLTNQLPQDENYLQKLKQGSVNIGNYKLNAVECHIHNYHDIIIKKIEYT